MFCGVSKVMVVFVPTFAVAPDVSTIYAGQRIWVRAVPSSHLDIDALTGLPLISVAWEFWCRTRPPCTLVYTERHIAVLPSILLSAPIIRASDIGT